MAPFKLLRLGSSTSKEKELKEMKEKDRHNTIAEGSSENLLRGSISSDLAGVSNMTPNENSTWNSHRLLLGDETFAVAEWSTPTRTVKQQSVDFSPSIRASRPRITRRAQTYSGESDSAYGQNQEAYQQLMDTSEDTMETVMDVTVQNGTGENDDADADDLSNSNTDNANECEDNTSTLCDVDSITTTQAEDEAEEESDRAAVEAQRHLIEQLLAHKSSKKIYAALAKARGLCALNDSCRCADCQARYLQTMDQDDEFCKVGTSSLDQEDGGLAAGGPMFADAFGHGACVIL